MRKHTLMKSLIYVLTIFFTIDGYSQIEFEKGYFIDINGQKTDCLVKNQDWRNNPKVFSYKLEADGVLAKGTIETIKEFGVYEGVKYIAVNVGIDRTSDRIDDLTYKRNATFQTELLFLKVLVEGKASLYSYIGKNINRFFYSVNQEPIEQLVHKKYRKEDVKIGFNNRYKQQLLLNAKCPETKNQEVESLKYERISLIKYFLKYNECSGSAPMSFHKIEQRNAFNLKFATGINYTSLTIDENLQWNHTFKTHFRNNISLRLGLEAEYILAYNKNKWAIFIEPTYQYFKAEADTKIQEGQIAQKANIDYSFMEFAGGVRYYMFLDKERKLYLNGLLISNFALTAKSSAISWSIRNPGGRTLDDFAPRNSFALGGGMEWNRFNFEIRYYPNREILRRYLAWNSNFTRLTFIAGYKFIKLDSKSTME